METQITITILEDEIKALQEHGYLEQYDGDVYDAMCAFLGDFAKGMYVRKEA